MIYFVDYGTGDIYPSSRGELESAIEQQAGSAYSPATLSAASVATLESIAAKFPGLDGFCFSRPEAEELSKTYRAFHHLEEEIEE